MKLQNRTVLITGAAGGIGRSLARACAAAGARVAITDVLADPLAATRAELAGDGHVALVCDLTDAGALAEMVEAVTARLGMPEVCFANAGVALGSDPIETPDAVWDQAFDVNVRQHVWLARALLPAWLDRGEGHFVATASAAGLLSQIGSAPYAVSKHAAVAFAEWLAITYGDRGLRVSCVCPMGVDTPMLNSSEPGMLEPLGARAVRAAGEILSPDQVAEVVLAGVQADRFLILPHPEVAGFIAHKATHYEEWLAGMRRLQARLG